MKIGSGDYVQAVTQSTFAAFIGMGASLLVLFYYLAKTGLLSSIFRKQEGSEGIDTRALLIDTIREAIPFIITGSAIQLFQIVDQMTFINVMSWFTDYSQKQLMVMFSYFSANPTNYHDLDCGSDFDWRSRNSSFDRELCEGDRKCRLGSSYRIT